MEHLQKKLCITQRRARKVIGQPRSTQRRNPKVRDDEGTLRSEIIRPASKYGRYGYRRITALLKRDGWRVNHKRVERIWRQEGLNLRLIDFEGIKGMISSSITSKIPTK